MQRPRQQQPVAAHRQRCVADHAQRDALRLVERAARARQLGEIERLVARLRHARVLRKRVGEPREVLDLLQERIEAVAHRLALRLGHELHAALEPVDRERHGGERVLELVRQLPREVTPRGLALGPRQRAAGLGQARGHGVERAGEQRQLARPRLGEQRVSRAVLDALERAREPRERLCHAARQEPRENACAERDGQHERCDGEPHALALDVHQDAHARVELPRPAHLVQLLPVAGVQAHAGHEHDAISHRRGRGEHARG